MKKINVFIFIVGIIIMSACGSSNTVALSVVTPSATQPPLTATITATITPTITPSPTPTPQPISSENIKNIYEDFQIGVGEISNAIWMLDGNIALTHSAGVSIYNAITFKLIRIARPVNKVSLSDSIISHNGRFVASLIDNQIIQVWDINTGEIISEIKTKCASTTSRTTRMTTPNYLLAMKRVFRYGS
jgi:WD40 repeat protein